MPDPTDEAYDHFERTSHLNLDEDGYARMMRESHRHLDNPPDPYEDGYARFMRESHRHLDGDRPRLNPLYRLGARNTTPWPLKGGNAWQNYRDVRYGYVTTHTTPIDGYTGSWIGFRPAIGLPRAD